MATIDGGVYLRINSANRPAAKQYSLLGLRPVSKGGFSSASMINNFGQTVGHASEEAKTPTRAFAWSNEYGLIEDLGSIYGGDSFATNINDKGVIVGYTTTPEKSLRGYLLGHGQMFDLGLLSSVTYDEAFSVATDINEDGHIVGYSHTSENKIHGYYWTHEQGMVDMGSFTDGQSYAYSINDNGVAVGWAQVSEKVAFRAFTWSVDKGLEELSEPTGLSSAAYAINNHNVIAGASGAGPLGQLLEAALWTKNGHIALGSFDGFPFSGCHALNEIGQAVGWVYPTRHCEMKKGRAFIWDETQGMQDLNFLIPEGSGWTLHKALGINNDGEIVGCGTFDGKLQAFLLTPVDYARNVSKHIDIQNLNVITNQKTGVVYRTVIIKNKSHKSISGPLHLVFRELTPWIKVLGAAGEYDDAPFRTVKVNDLPAGSSVSTTIQFSNPQNLLLDYATECYAGIF
jgi:probable HAF family extracellular repeat protein